MGTNNVRICVHRLEAENTELLKLVGEGTFKVNMLQNQLLKNQLMQNSASLASYTHCKYTCVCVCVCVFVCVCVCVCVCLCLCTICYRTSC